MAEYTLATGDRGFRYARLMFVAYFDQSSHLDASGFVCLAGRWIGLSPDGVIFPSDPVCGVIEFDMQLDLIQTGSSLSGTSVQRTRRTSGAPGCDGPVGKVQTDSVSGTVGSGTVSIVFSERISCSGSFTANRMSGTCGGGDRTVSFAVNRQ